MAAVTALFTAQLCSTLSIIFGVHSSTIEPILQSSFIISWVVVFDTCKFVCRRSKSDATLCWSKSCMSTVQKWCFLLLCARKVLYTLDLKLQSLKRHLTVSLLCMCIFKCAKYCVSLQVSAKLHSSQFNLAVTCFERAWLCP